MGLVHTQRTQGQPPANKSLSHSPLARFGRAFHVKRGCYTEQRASRARRPTARRDVRLYNSNNYETGRLCAAMMLCHSAAVIAAPIAYWPTSRPVAPPPRTHASLRRDAATINLLSALILAYTVKQHRNGPKQKKRMHVCIMRLPRLKPYVTHTHTTGEGEAK